MASSAALDGPSVSPYQRALASFNRRNYDRALGQLAQAPAGSSAVERADALNLRGAIYLRQGRFEQARTAFAEAVRMDSGLWAARFNEAEVSFREKRYAASREQFDALLGRTSRVFHSEEHRFLEYKVLLAGLCAGQEQPVLEFIASHKSDPTLPLAWYYLNAAVEQWHDRPQKAAQWIAQADSQQIPGNREPYTESFERLRSPSDRPVDLPDRTELAAQRRGRRGGESADSSRIATARTRPADPADSKDSPALSAPSTTVAMVQLLPDRSPASETDGKAMVEPSLNTETVVNAPPGSTDVPDAAGVPPSGNGLFPSGEDRLSVSPPSASPGVMARPRRARSTPTPTPAPTATPDAVTANQKGATSPAASPSPATPSPGETEAATASTAVPPSPEFTQKYESAYVKFLEKDYPGTLALLDEADKIQPKQPQSATLRAQVFKQDYEAAYLAFRKLDYPTALAKLDEADQAQPNYPDALNLRGLVYSKQRVYDRAEAMFKRAVEADPTLWAAKFNYAELPFNRGDYTTARGRFEDLLAETDATKRPREAELTQYKVFLTLLMEGKTDQARSFMDHFNFSGATPAKYFCNAAMNFRAGTVDKAENWIDSAKREYPAQLVSIFLESFYRLGWMTDPSTPVSETSALAAASPTPAVAASPAVEAVAARVSPTPSPAKVAAATPTPGPTAVGTGPALLAASAPSASPGLVGPAASASLTPAAAPTAPLATAAPSTTPVVAAASVSPAPSTASATPIPTPGMSPEASVAPTVAVAAETPATPEAGAATSSASDELLRYGLIGAVVLYGLYTVFRALNAARRRKTRRVEAMRRPLDSEVEATNSPEKIEISR